MCFVYASQLTGLGITALAHHYEAQDQHYLATPLFLQALALSPPSSCRSVVLMNNVATCLAQQQQQPPPPWAASDQSSVSNGSSNRSMPSEHSGSTAQARQWALKALAVAAAIPPAARTHECATGCTAATHALGELAERDGDVQQARRLFREAGELARRAGFEEGVREAEAALARVGSDP